MYKYEIKFSKSSSDDVSIKIIYFWHFDNIYDLSIFSYFSSDYTSIYNLTTASDLSSSMTTTPTTKSSISSEGSSPSLTSVIISTTSSYPTTTLPGQGLFRPPVMGRPKHCDISHRSICQVRKIF